MPPHTRPGPMAYWTWASAVIFTSGGVSLLGPTLLGGLFHGYALGTLYPALLLAGALVYDDRRVPRWLIPGALAVGAARLVLSASGLPTVSHALSLAVEPGLVLAAAALVQRAVAAPDATLPQRLLAPALVAMAALEAGTAGAMLAWGAMSTALLVVWLVAIPSLLALQVAAAGDRKRRDLQRARDLLEQRVAEETERYRTISDLSSDYSFALRIGPDRKVQGEWATDALSRTTGFHPREMEGQGWLGLVHPDDRARVDAAFDEVIEGRRTTLEHRIVTKAGEERWINVRFGAVRETVDGSLRLVGAARDVTERVLAEQERRRLDLRMREMQHLESLGRMAGGIAHDFNNVLTVILGNATLAEADLENRQLRPERLRRIRVAAQYAAGLADQILTYSGKGAVALEALDLTRLVGEMGDLLRTSIPGRTTLEMQLAEDLPAVEGDVTQVRQVLFNLVSNAVEALGDEKGTVRVRTGAAEVRAAELADGFGVADPAPGEYVFLEVSDTGPGLAPELRARMFEPFFTTRTSGRGLGLASVLGIVRAHRGVIVIDSEPGRGAVFRAYFPRSRRKAQPPAEPFRRDDRPRVQGTVLVVDDDAGVRDVAREFLERAGFDVLTASGGVAALELVEGREGALDAVVLDLAMPDMSGEETFLKLRQIRPELPVVLASGYDRERAAARFSARGVADFVRKPFEPEQLVESVRSAAGR